MISDSALLRQYAEHHDEVAFAELVRRHIDLVYSVALRQTNGDAHLAEDAVQAVFTDLARKARSLSGRATLAGWLHTSARFAAGNAVRGEARRRVREQEAVTMHELTSAPDVSWGHLRPLLDESVGQLKEADRDAIVLRFFEGKSHEEIGVLLGLSENSANKRVERALEKLREHFSRRGVTASSALLATAIIENSVQAAPVELAANVTKAALAGTGVVAGGLFLKLLLMSTKTKIAFALIIILAIAALLIMRGPTPDNSMAISAVKPAASAAIPTQAKVAQPVVVPVVPLASTTAASSPVAVTNQQAELQSAIAEFIHAAETQDLVGIMQSMMDPSAIKSDMERYKLTSPEELALKLYHEQQDPAQQMADMLQMLHAIQGQTPTMENSGNRAHFEINPPINGHKAMNFTKKDGLWYIN